MLGSSILEITFLQENITLEKQAVEKIWSKAHQISPNKTLFILLKTAKYSLLDKEARNYLITEMKTWPKIAIIIDNLGQRIMGQVVIGLTGNASKIKLFEDEEKAIEWLNNQAIS